MHKSIIILSMTLLVSCNSETKSKVNSEKTWRQGWRMMENLWDEDLAAAEMKFDSLLISDEPINDRFLLHGLEIKTKRSKKEEVANILSDQPKAFLNKFCKEDFAVDYKLCLNKTKEIIENEKLQLEIIDLFIDDQAIRGNLMNDLISKYNIDTTGIKMSQDWSNPDEVSVDEINRNRLKSIFEEHGFPSRALIGKDAMQGIFLIIQHADGDKAWQKQQLPNLKEAALSGDVPKQNYTYLFDRIKVNNGEPQRYGSQFANVNREKGIAILRETEDLQNLDKRRREMDMMPIDLYKRLILKN